MTQEGRQGTTGMNERKDGVAVMQKDMDSEAIKMMQLQPSAEHLEANGPAGPDSVLQDHLQRTTKTETVPTPLLIFQFSFPGLKSLCIIFILNKSESTFTKPWRLGKAASLGRLKIYCPQLKQTAGGRLGLQ